MNQLCSNEIFFKKGENGMAETVNSFLKQPFYRLNFNLYLNCLQT